MSLGADVVGGVVGFRVVTAAACLLVAVLAVVTGFEAETLGVGLRLTPKGEVDLRVTPNGDEEPLVADFGLPVLLGAVDPAAVLRSVDLRVALIAGLVVPVEMGLRFTPNGEGAGLRSVGLGVVEGVGLRAEGLTCFSTDSMKRIRTQDVTSN